MSNSRISVWTTPNGNQVELPEARFSYQHISMLPRYIASGFP